MPVVARGLLATVRREDVCEEAEEPKATLRLTDRKPRAASAGGYPRNLFRTELGDILGAALAKRDTDDEN